MLGIDVISRLCELPPDQIRAGVRELDLSQATPEELSAIRMMLTVSKQLRQGGIESEKEALAMLATSYSGWQDNPHVAERLFSVQQDLRMREREKLWETDPVAWGEDRLGIKRETIVWSLNPGYEEHQWDSALVTKDRSGEQVTLIETPLQDPLHYAALRLAAGDPRIVIPSATGAGKSYLCALKMLWFLEMHPHESNVMMFGTKLDSLRQASWKEVTRFFPRFREKHPNAVIHEGSLRLYMDDSGETAREEWALRGVTAAQRAKEGKAGAAKGSHAPYQLFVFEEGQSAIASILGSVIDGVTGENNHILMLGNPLGIEDQMYGFAMMPNVTWVAVSAFDHPNVVMNDSGFIPGAADNSQLKRKLDDVGGDTEHADFKGPIRGRFPVASSQTLVSSALLAETMDHLVNPSDAWQHHDHGGPASMYPESEGTTTIYFTPQNMSPWRYIIAADTAGDEIDGDSHAATVFDTELDMPVALIHMKGSRGDFACEVRRVANLYSSAGMQGPIMPLLSWEVAGGHSLQRERCILDYPKQYIYRSRRIDHKSRRKSKSLGWRISKKTRVEGQECLKKWIRRVHEHLQNTGRSKLIIPQLHRELTTFIATTVYQDGGTRYEHANGCHDDTVLCTIQALYILEELKANNRLGVHHNWQSNENVEAYRQGMARMESEPEPAMTMGQGMSRITSRSARSSAVGNPMSQYLKRNPTNASNPLRHLL